MPSVVVIKPGVVFWPKATGCHPYIVLSAPVGGLVLLVNFSDLNHTPNTECILRAGEHSAVTKDSAVRFKKWTEQICLKMGQVLSEGHLVVHYPDLSPELLDRVIQAARSSEFIPEAIKVKYGLRTKDKDTTAPF